MAFFPYSQLDANIECASGRIFTFRIHSTLEYISLSASLFISRPQYLCLVKHIDLFSNFSIGFEFQFFFVLLTIRIVLNTTFKI